MELPQMVGLPHSPRQSMGSMANYSVGTPTYNVNHLLAFALMIWIPVLVGCGFACYKVEPRFNFSKAMLYVITQTLGIGYSSHVTSEMAIYFSVIISTAFLPLSTYVAMLYTIWWTELTRIFFPSFPQIARIASIWFATTALTAAFLPRESFATNLYMIQNLYTTNGYLMEDDLQWYKFPVFVHASCVYCGSLYIILEMLIHRLEIITNDVSHRIRKTIAGMRQVDKIVAECQNLDIVEIEEVMLKLESLTSSRSRHATVSPSSIRPSYFHPNSHRASRQSRLSTISCQSDIMPKTVETEKIVDHLVDKMP